MRIINADSPNDALQAGALFLAYNGDVAESRGGNVLVSPVPVMTVHKDPTRRVLVGATRDANPFFHIAEAMWMLAGQNDLATLQAFVKRFGEYSDDGVSLYGAYGFRWRHWFGYDQIETAIRILREDPASRRVVISMWDGGQADTWEDGNDGASDLVRGGAGFADVPCNTHIYLGVRGGKLSMTVCCRSNDAIWGAHGANLVHFSFLLEYLAARLDLQIGTLYQLSNNYHVYESITGNLDLRSYSEAVRAEDVYTAGAGYQRTPVEVYQVPLLGTGTSHMALMEDIKRWLRDPTGPAYSNGEYHSETPFFGQVFYPMLEAWRAHKAGDADMIHRHLAHVVAEDWRAAASCWLNKRRNKGDKA